MKPNQEEELGKSKKKIKIVEFQNEVYENKENKSFKIRDAKTRSEKFIKNSLEKNEKS